MHVLSVSSLKGGVGKTTVVLGLASAAFAAGLRTLVVDLDPQCDATTGLGAIGEFETNVASVLKNPKHDVVSRAIVSSAWGKSAGGLVDVLPGSTRSVHYDTPHPTVRQTWILEEALHRVEKDYDIVIIDTPPSINALTRTAWVASDRVLLVTEPGIFSVVAAERAQRALEEIREAVTKRVRLLGFVVNRHRPASKEQEFRLQELHDLFGDLILPKYLEEKSHLQQTQGAARPIHTWPGEGAVEVAHFFTWLLTQVRESFDEVTEELRVENKPVKRSVFRRMKRGKKGPEKVSIEQAFDMLGESVTEVEESRVIPESSPSTAEPEIIPEVSEPSTDTGGWNFKLEIERPNNQPE
ncbi:MAG: ParA family protein [Micrococcales bacterium]